MLDEDDQKDAGYLTESKGKLTKQIQEGLMTEWRSSIASQSKGLLGF